MKDIDYSRGERITAFCIIGNIVLSALKLAAGIFGGSKAMISDALHSASDIVATSVVLIGIKIAKKPIDKEHPYGHGRVESISAAFVGVVLVFAAIYIIIGIIESIAEHSFSTPTFLALGAAVMSIAVKEVMYRITYAAGKKIGSESIMADAWHHRSDAYSSIGSFLGILGSMIGKWTGVEFLKYLDPIAGAVVAGFIFKIAYDILKLSVKNLMDSSPHDTKLKSIKDAALSVDGIISVPSLKARYSGQRLFVDIEIGVLPDITVEQGHKIADSARDCIIGVIDDVYEVNVHVEPQRGGDGAKYIESGNDVTDRPANMP